MVYNKFILIDELHRYVKEFGNTPSSRDIDISEGYPSAFTYRYVFGSWNKALDEANLKRIRDGNNDHKNLNTRTSKKYLIWRELCKDRDNNKCVICDNIDNLVVHHIKSYNDDLRLRTEINNGVTLCQSCHMKAHNNKYKIEKIE
jgi:hypothetical protein